MHQAIYQVMDHFTVGVNSRYAPDYVIISRVNVKFSQGTTGRNNLDLSGARRSHCNGKTT